MRVNYWITLRGNARTEIEDRIAAAQGEEGVAFDPEVDTDVAAQILMQRTHDRNNVTRGFKQAGNGANVTTIYSCYWREKTDADADVALMEAAYPGRVVIVGGWDYHTGALVEPLSPTLISYMPDLATYPDGPEQPPVMVPASELTQVNLLFGQTPRQFV